MNGRIVLMQDKSVSLNRKPLTSADYVLLILEKYKEVTALNVDDVIYLAKTAGLPIRYEFVFSPTGPKSPDLRDSLLSLLAARIIQLEPESYRYFITDYGKKVLDEIKRNTDTKNMSFLENFFQILHKLRDAKALNELSIFIYLEGNGGEKQLELFLGDTKRISFYKMIRDELLSNRY